MLHAPCCLHRLKSLFLPRSDVRDNESYNPRPRSGRHTPSCTAARTPCALERRRSADDSTRARSHSPARVRARGPQGRLGVAGRRALHALALARLCMQRLQPQPPPLEHDVRRATGAGVLLVYGQPAQPQPVAFVILDDKKGCAHLSQACARGVHTGAKRTGLRVCTCTATLSTMYPEGARGTRTSPAFPLGRASGTPGAGARAGLSWRMRGCARRHRRDGRADLLFLILMNRCGLGVLPTVAKQSPFSDEGWWRKSRKYHVAGILAVNIDAINAALSQVHTPAKVNNPLGRTCC
ncbi:hypothetical protein GGX14DRAFT_397002 [Mycena pura]|uniref:Uncharacterized protein n=1 Tax=Mycena pura TaxID=153505 RepID=A0AAD6V9B3_9AGAR|nr:hypothetical protein GGX14DRAFT_397002 [Mycena pura]